MGSSFLDLLPNRSMYFAITWVSLMIAIPLSLARPHTGNTPNANGDYNFSFEANDQKQRQARQESGFGAESEVVKGSYSFDTPEGVQVSITYTADENGYYPKGTGIHPAIARMLEQLRRRNGLQ